LGPASLLIEPPISAQESVVNPSLGTPPLDLLPESNSILDDDIRTQVWALLTSLYPSQPCTERRQEHRYPFPYLVHLTPVADDGITPAGETIAVVGKHLSARGLGFYHPKPLAQRRMIASFEAGNGTWMAFLIDLTWCRFTRQHWYESGGRFLQAVPPPVPESK
jgi:hypothetical protein